jgi:hypothetical protein
MCTASARAAASNGNSRDVGDGPLAQGKNVSDRTDLIELLEGQAVYIQTCRRDNHLGRIKVLLREEILDRNAKALTILRSIRPPAARQAEIDRLRLELGQAQEKPHRIREILVAYKEQIPRGPYARCEGVSVLQALGRILNGVNR